MLKFVTKLIIFLIIFSNGYPYLRNKENFESMFFKFLSKYNITYVISPYTILIPIALTTHFLKGENLKRLLHLLQINDSILIDSVNERFLNIIEKTNSPYNNITIHTDFYTNHINGNSKYKDCFKTYKINIKHMDNIIYFYNNTIGTKYEGLLNQIYSINDLNNPKTNFVIFNYIKFSGSWKFPFKIHDYKLSKFLGEHNLSNCHYMIQKFRNGVLDFYEDDKVEVIKLPFINEDISMILFLPKNIELHEFKYNYFDITLKQYVNKFSKKFQIYIELPKTGILNVLKIENVLEKLNLKNIFTNHSNQIYSDFKIDFFYPNIFRHLTVMFFNEFGINDSLSNEIPYRSSGYFDTNSKLIRKLYFNKPFLFVIKHNYLDYSLFIGEISNCNSYN